MVGSIGHTVQQVEFTPKWDLLVFVYLCLIQNVVQSSSNVKCPEIILLGNGTLNKAVLNCIVYIFSLYVCGLSPVTQVSSQNPITYIT